MFNIVAYTKTYVILVVFLVALTGCSSQQTNWEGESLSQTEIYVTQYNGTEPPYLNEYWNNSKQGIYVDVLSGEPLFSSTHKYKSGTGWPSFYKPLNGSDISLYVDTSLRQQRVGLQGNKSGSHLGHVFDDGPEPTGKRYCMNSAALDFIPKEELVEEGYEQYLYLFEE